MSQPDSMDAAEVDLNDFDVVAEVEPAPPAADPRDPGVDWVATGDPRVDDAVARLGDLTDLPVDEQVGVYEEVHRRLHDALAGLAPDA